MTFRPHYLVDQTAAVRLPVLGLIICLFSACSQSTPTGTSGGDVRVNKSRVIAQGQLLPDGGIVRLAAAPGDIVSKVHVEPGQNVTAGDLLINMRSEEVLASQIEAVKFRYEQAVLAREQAVAAAELQVNAAGLQLERAKAVFESVSGGQKLLDVAEQQVEAGAAMSEKLKRLAANDVTREFIGQLEVEQQELKVGEARLAQLTRKEEHRRALKDARFAVQAAEVDVENAKLALSAALQSEAAVAIQKELEALNKKSVAAKVKAPTEGKILSVRVSPGEATSAFPLIEMANVSQMVCEVEINEQDAALVEVGQTAKITSRAFEEPMQGQVIKKYALVGKPQLRQLDPLARVDYRTITAVVQLDKASSKRAASWLQLQVKVEIELE